MSIKSPNAVSGLRPIGDITQSLLAKFIIDETDTFGGMKPVDWPEVSPTNDNAAQATEALPTPPRAPAKR